MSCCPRALKQERNVQISYNSTHTHTHTHTRFILMQCVQITSVADASTWPLAWLLACAVRTPWLPAWPPALPAPVLAHAMMGHRHHCCLAVLEAVQPYASLHAARVQVRVRGRGRVRAPRRRSRPRPRPRTRRTRSPPCSPHAPPRTPSSASKCSTCNLQPRSSPPSHPPNSPTKPPLPRSNAAPQAVPAPG